MITSLAPLAALALWGRRIVQRPVRLTDEQVTALLAAEWTLRADGRWLDPQEGDALSPWAAWRRCCVDAGRNAGAA